jgi:ribosomal protein S18 acetylase RimI-like enzyme
MRARRAGPHEVDAVTDLLVAMHAENGIGKLAFRKVEALVQRLVLQGSVLVLLEGERVVGTVGLEVSEWWYSADRFVGDYFFFVHPDYRSPEAAETLMDAAKAYARERGLPLLMGPLTRVDTLLKIRWYRTQGFELVGGFLLKEW